MSTKNKFLNLLNTLSLTALVPFIKLVTGDNPRQQLRDLMVLVGFPVIAFVVFLFVWHSVAINIVTKYGTVPTPTQVAKQAKVLYQDHLDTQEKKSEYFKKNQERAQQMKKKAETFKQQGKIKDSDKWMTRARQTADRNYPGEPSYFENILTSIKTVFAGFFLASLIAIPVGVFCGLSKSFMAAVNPLIQVFKPVSPLAWFPIVAIIIGGFFPKPDEAPMSLAFMSSAITVCLCSLWPTLVNTALGVSAIDKDYLNVARVIKLGPFAKIWKIILPASLPLMFTGLRISLGVGWMVLIAAEMLAQNPGLGKFVWDMFQNGSSETLSQIMVAVFTIGVIGFFLDRIMVILQKVVSFDSPISA